MSDSSPSPMGGTMRGVERTALKVRLASEIDQHEAPSCLLSPVSDYDRHREGAGDIRAFRSTIFGPKLTASFATFAGIPNTVALQGQLYPPLSPRRTASIGMTIGTYRLIKSAGLRIPSEPPPGPLEKMTPFPPVMRTISRAFVIQFWRYRRPVSAETCDGGQSAAAYRISS